VPLNGKENLISKDLRRYVKRYIERVELTSA
jgi:hypothetical protein